MIKFANLFKEKITEYSAWDLLNEFQQNPDLYSYKPLFEDLKNIIKFTGRKSKEVCSVDPSFVASVIFAIIFNQDLHEDTIENLLKYLTENLPPEDDEVLILHRYLGRFDKFSEELKALITLVIQILFRIRKEFVFTKKLIDSEQIVATNVAQAYLEYLSLPPGKATKARIEVILSIMNSSDLCKDALTDLKDEWGLYSTL